MSLGSLLSKYEPEHFSEMTYLTVKDVIKELQGITNETVMQNEIKKLAPEQLDVLMKVVYIGLANDCRNSTIYFKWHAAVYEHGSSGCIIRTITDKAPISQPS